jgi:hypothetical protein
MRLQNLRADASRLAAQSSAAHGRSLALRAGIAAAQAKVSEAAGATDVLAGHVEQRRGVVQQAKSAAAVSEEKATTVATQAPGIAERATAGGAQSSPMARDAQGLAATSSSAQPDDAEAGEKTREQSGQINRVGGQLRQIDQAISQTGTRAGQLSQDAATAQARNTASRGHVAEAEAAVDRTQVKIDSMRGQTQAAQGRLSALRAGPVEMATSATTLQERAEQVSAESVALEERLHAAQTGFRAATSAIPPAVPRRRGAFVQREAYAGRERVNLTAGLPGWFTGEDPPSARERAAHNTRAAEQRRQELAAIDAAAGGHFETLGAGGRTALALSLTYNRLRGELGETNWPKFGLTLLRGLVDPRVSLTGVVSGFGMILSGGANLASWQQWQRDPLGNVLKSAADIATGVTIVLGSIAGLAVAIIAICAAIILVTLGFASPVCLPVISICTTIAATVGPWAVTAAEIALVLQGLVLIKNLIDAATAPTAQRLQGSVENMAEDAKAMGNMATIIVADRAGRAVGPRIARTAGRIQAGLEASSSATARQLGQSMGDIGAAMLEGQARADAWAGRRPASPNTVEGAGETPPATEAPTTTERPTPSETRAAAPEAAPAERPGGPAERPGGQAERPGGQQAQQPGTEVLEGERVVAEQPTTDGQHRVKVTEDACFVCSGCENIRSRYRTEIERNPGLDLELREAAGLRDPVERAQRYTEIEQRLNEAQRAEWGRQTPEVKMADFERSSTTVQRTLERIDRQLRDPALREFFDEPEIAAMENEAGRIRGDQEAAESLGREAGSADPAFDDFRAELNDARARAERLETRINDAKANPPIQQAGEFKYQRNPKHDTPGPDVARQPARPVELLEHSVLIEDGPGRINVDPVNQEYVVFREHQPGRDVYHGYALDAPADWNRLRPAERRALRDAGLVDSRGRIQ